jgi:hypothetical protein
MILGEIRREASGQRVAYGYYATDIQTMRRLRILRDAYENNASSHRYIATPIRITRRLWILCNAWAYIATLCGETARRSMLCDAYR